MKLYKQYRVSDPTGLYQDQMVWARGRREAALVALALMYDAPPHLGSRAVREELRQLMVVQQETAPVAL